MNFFFVLAVALALAMDAFTVSLGTSLALRRFSRGQAFRLSFFFGFFQFLMPVLGWVVGRTILARAIEAYDHWVAFGLLLLVGGRMIVSSLKKEKEREEPDLDPTKGFSLLVLSVATSVDALAVGASLAALQVAILYPAAVIGLVTFVLTLLGSKIGPLLGRAAGRWAGCVGGAILILIGARILLGHL